MRTVAPVSPLPRDSGIHEGVQLHDRFAHFLDSAFSPVRREFFRCRRGRGGGGAPATSIASPSSFNCWAPRTRCLRKKTAPTSTSFPRAKQEVVHGVGHCDIYLLPPRPGTRGPLPLSPPVDCGSRWRRRVSLYRFGRAAERYCVSVHGIRASVSGWPKRAADIVSQNYQNTIPVLAGYSYFSALNFAIPFMRRRQIRWMQDQFAYRFAKHPGAKFYFLGHSNGTYLLGRLLEPRSQRKV